MSRGPENVTTTTNSEPPQSLRSGFNTAGRFAEGEFMRDAGYGGSNNYVPGDISSTNGGTYQKQYGGQRGGGGGGGGGGVGLPSGANTPGSQLTRAAQGLNLSTLQGDFLNPDTNPYLEGTFNRAADLTRGRLDSEFAGGGRNLGAAMPARSEELQTLASNIYGGNYQRERGIQDNAMGLSQTLDPTNRLINQLAGLTPGAGGVTSSTQPYFKTGLF